MIQQELLEAICCVVNLTVNKCCCCWVVNLTVNKCCSVAQSCPTLCDPMDCSTPGFLSFTISWILLKLMSIESMMSSNHIILCHPLLLLSSIFPRVRVFTNKSALCIKKPKHWCFNFSISPSNEYSGLISFRMDWFDLLAVQGTLKSLLQHHNLKHQFFCTQPSLWSNSHIHVWHDGMIYKVKMRKLTFTMTGYYNGGFQLAGIG